MTIKLDLAEMIIAATNAGLYDPISWQAVISEAEPGSEYAYCLCCDWRAKNIEELPASAELDST